VKKNRDVILKVLVYFGFICITVTLLAQTPAINTERIKLLEDSQVRQDARLSEFEKAVAEIKVGLAKVETSSSYNRDLLIGFALGLASLLGANLLQGRKTHNLMNGAQALLRDELKAALLDASKLRSQLVACVERQKCPLLRDDQPTEAGAPPSINNEAEH
jgi:hypothetical protein